MIGVDIVDDELGRGGGCGTEAEAEGGIGVGDGGKPDRLGFAGVEIYSNEAVAHFTVEEGLPGAGEEASEEGGAEEVSQIGDLGFVGDGGVGPVRGASPNVSVLNVNDAVHFVGDVTIKGTAMGESKGTDEVATCVQHIDGTGGMEEGDPVGGGEVIDLIGGFEWLGKPVRTEGFETGASDLKEGRSSDDHRVGIDGKFGCFGNGCGSGGSGRSCVDSG